MDRNYEPTRFTLDALERFLGEFEPLRLKYTQHLWPEAAQDPNKSMLEFQQYERPRRRIITDQTSPETIFKDLRLVYGKKEPINSYVNIFVLTRDKLISQYLNIEGLDKLFTAQYFRYEWQMHLGIDYSNNSYSYYRDHFIHQVKNAYQMFRLLTKFDFMNHAVDIVQERATISAHYIDDQAHLACDELYNKARLIKVYQDIYCENKKLNEKLIIRSFTERILMSAAFIASLFHDIGYPIAHAQENNGEMARFLPTIDYFFSGDGQYSRISNLLVNSLLFTAVPPTEIRERYVQKDHGTLSALALLLYFYESGEIRQLDAVERASIEIAALTIYNHTLKYKKYEKKGEFYYRPVFYRNPLSFLFRLCDDIQEWDRLYLYLSNTPDFRVCRKCKTPSLARSLLIEGYDTTAEIDVCACCEESAIKLLRESAGRFKPVPEASVFACFEQRGEENISDIGFRKLNHIKICDYVELKFADKNDSVLNIHVHYSPYKLLQMAYIDPGFGCHRAKELNGLRERLENQSVMPTVIVNSYITTNPIALKVRILEEFLNSLLCEDNAEPQIKPSDIKGILLLSEDDRSVLLNTWNNSREIISDMAKGINEFSKLTDVLNKLYKRPTKKMSNIISELSKALSTLATLIYPDNTVRAHITVRLDEYIQLLTVALLTREMPPIITNTMDENKFVSKLVKIFGKRSPVRNFEEHNHSDSLDFLLRDYFGQIHRYCEYSSAGENQNHLRPFYLKQFHYKDDERSRFCQKVKQYTGWDTYRPFDANDTLDYYYDIYFFRVLSYATEFRNERSWLPDQDTDTNS